MKRTLILIQLQSQCHHSSHKLQACIDKRNSRTHTNQFPAAVTISQNKILMQKLDSGRGGLTFRSLMRASFEAGRASNFDPSSLSCCCSFCAIGTELDRNFSQLQKLKSNSHMKGGARRRSRMCSARVRECSEILGGFASEFFRRSFEPRSEREREREVRLFEIIDWLRIQAPQIYASRGWGILQIRAPILRYLQFRHTWSIKVFRFFKNYGNFFMDYNLCFFEIWITNN